MGWFWADNSTDIIQSQQSKEINKFNDNQSKCPVDHSKFTKKFSNKNINKHNNNDDDINPLNNMPNFIPAEKQPGQILDLSTERTFSTIPRGENENEGVWEYPSPQQMFNAMLRKGKAEDIPEDAVESMVDVHNFLNEGAWQEILQWEKSYIEISKIEPRLIQFTGRPDDLSPKARLYLQLSKIFPETFNTEPPFDRHDWYVLRSSANGNKNEWEKIRYIIDYYGGPDDENGMPTFFLDVRPALDNLTNVKDRLNHLIKPLWNQALGKE
ncbi:hypothetical protein WICMUC_005745 [Wickerhamomyces mucosus]|uniref:Holocytochrome c-type synthase n=1 Tax=Wickerhamomyces mucosus TaxID=1378264 RepID=A0A9P8P3E7_9ASCO|nr:hypothetical protein WICMUC_005745 [Wickerhamomyces mucosus]